MSRMAKPSGIQSLLLVQLQAGVGATQADRFWTSIKGRVRHDSSHSFATANMFVGASLTQYLQAVGIRETKAIQCLKPSKQIALFCGPKLYRPGIEKKVTALSWYRKVVDALIPNDIAITRPCFWHDDLHDDNIFIDPHNPGKIASIIDWQSCHISHLFNHNIDPAFLDWDGLEPDTLDLVPRPKLSELSVRSRI
ncbi:phosphotransferase enzyme family protein [Penicillium cf. griseofulvum]|nr:phosphotransferase enzyme family protein [Penicillium cf. griseofulvum]